jgi:hypothetical protein
MLTHRLAALAIGTSLVLGCSKETPPAAEEPRSASNAVAPQAAPAANGAPADAAPATAAVGAAANDAAPAGASKFTDPAFELSLEPPKAALKAGQAGNVEVLLVAKAPFHVNDKYPIKLKLKETPGLKYDNLTLTKDAAKVEAMKAVMPVAFTPDAGKRTVAGTFSFSVCTEDKCLMEKRELALEVAVE